MDLGRSGPAGQDVLGADELSGLGQDGGAALLDDQIAELSDQGLEARPLVGSEPPHSVPMISSDMGEFFPLQQGRLFHHFLGVADGHINGLQGCRRPLG